MKFMKHIVFGMLLICGSFCLYAQDTTAQASAIIESARNRAASETISTRSRLVITAKDGSTSERVIDQFSKDDAAGNARTVIIFQRPASVAGTRFLTIDNSSGGSDRWIFLPALGRIRRIAASESGGSFMGTDFSYDDVSTNDRNVSLDVHNIIGEEPLNGRVCYMIQSVSKDSGYQYSKTINWIDKESRLIYKSDLYDRRGTLIKVLEMSNFQEVQGRLTPMQTKVSTLASGTSTTINMDIIRYDDPLPESIFTTQYLETGRVR